jgi:hypothetical protein
VKISTFVSCFEALGFFSAGAGAGAGAYCLAGFYSFLIGFVLAGDLASDFFSTGFYYFGADFFCFFSALASTGAGVVFSYFC